MKKQLKLKPVTNRFNKQRRNLVELLLNLTPNKSSWEHQFLSYLLLKNSYYKLNEHELKALDMMAHFKKDTLGDAYHVCTIECKKYKKNQFKRASKKDIQAKMVPLFDVNKVTGGLPYWGDATNVKLVI